MGKESVQKINKPKIIFNNMVFLTKLFSLIELIKIKNID